MRARISEQHFGEIMRRGKIIFTGSFGDYILKAIGLTLLGFVTFGLAWLYLYYWMVKYFVERLEVEYPE